MSARTGEMIGSEDIRSRNEQRSNPLFADRIQVYPKKVDGTIRRIKWAALIVLLGIYYLVPWIRWDRGPGAPDQAVLIDMPGRRAYFFWIEIWPQEVYYIAGLLILGALGLFLVTSLAGRIWCGFACPQTVWTDLFLWVERLIEGDRSARIRLDKAPTSTAKVFKKVAKHGSWLVISLLTGGAWIMYFNDAPTVVVDLATAQASGAVYFFVALFTGTTYLLAGWAREQVCTYMCPWPRIQSALLDDDSLVVTYRGWRGERRGKHKKGESWEGRGHCIDCRQCVAACPTGIDIRDGLQLECIGCGLCIDACNEVMDKIDLPRGLIAFDTEWNQALRSAGKPPVYRLVRPRTVVYAALLVVVSAIMLWSLATRSTLELNVLHDRSPLFVTLSDGSIRNGYTIKVLNKLRDERSVTLMLEGLSGATLSVVGQATEGSDSAVLEARPDSVATYQVYVRLPNNTAIAESMPMAFRVTESESGETARHETVFRAPPS